MATSCASAPKRRAGNLTDISGRTPAAAPPAAMGVGRELFAMFRAGRRWRRKGWIGHAGARRPLTLKAWRRRGLWN
jgi:hypothetical protein